MKKSNFSKRTGYGTLSPVVWHQQAKEAVSFFPDKVRSEIGYLLFRLQKGEVLGMPKARPMPQVGHGAYELRVRGADGSYRLFYVIKTEFGILALHAFQKKTQKTDWSDLKLGQRRLKELLGVLNG